MEKFYLGISLGFNSSACVMSNQRGILAAISQERLNGEKNTKEVPFDAALKCLEIANVSEIETICVSHYEEISKRCPHRNSLCYKEERQAPWIHQGLPKAYQSFYPDRGTPRIYISATIPDLSF